MDRDYASLLPQVLMAMFPDAGHRHAVERKLARYGTESWHAGVARVHLGILKLAAAEPGRLEAFIELACRDYRDLLCAAEYPLSSRDYRLKQDDPEKYRQYQADESAAYDNWLNSLITE